MASKSRKKVEAMRTNPEHFPWSHQEPSEQLLSIPGVLLAGREGARPSGQGWLGTEALQNGEGNS